jgi:uncharacterized protein
VKRFWLLLIPILVLLVAVWTWVALYPGIPTDLGGVESLDSEAVHVRIPVARDSLDGWYLQGTEPGIVLLLHGHGRNHERMWRYGQFLRKAGYTLLALDFRSARPSHRLPTTLGYYELADAQAALEWLRGRPELGGNVIGVLGESLGGAVALRLAAANRDVIAIVDDSGFATGKDAIDDTFRRFHLPTWPTPLARAVAKTLTGHDPGDNDVLAAARALDGRPVLFVHGATDSYVSPEQTRALWRAAGERDSLWIIPSVGHNQGWVKDRTTYEGKVTSFFDQHLLLAWARANAARLTHP